MTPRAGNALLVMVCLLGAVINYLIVVAASHGSRSVDVFVTVLNSFGMAFCLACALGCFWFRPKD